MLVGSDGDRLRNDVALDVKWRSRYGALVAWRGFDVGSFGGGAHDGFVTGGLVFEAGAARPRLVLDLVAELGVDLDQRAPIAGGALRTTIGVIGPLGVSAQLGAYGVIDGVEHSRFVLHANALACLRW